MIDSSYLTVAELREYLKVGRTTAYKLCRQPDFPSARIGKRIIVDKKRLDNEWVRSQQNNKNKGKETRK